MNKISIIDPYKKLTESFTKQIKIADDSVIVLNYCIKKNISCTINHDPNKGTVVTIQ